MLHSCITVELPDGCWHTRSMILNQENLLCTFACVAGSLAGMQAELPFGSQILVELAGRVAQLESVSEGHTTFLAQECPAIHGWLFVRVSMFG
jgi:hypothetical protein